MRKLGEECQHEREKFARMNAFSMFIIILQYTKCETSLKYHSSKVQLFAFSKVTLVFFLSAKGPALGEGEEKPSRHV